jgi:hypothetical protein
MNSTFVASVVPAETVTEVKTTSAISNEVQSHSQNLQKSLCDLHEALEAINGIAWPDTIRQPKCAPHLICLLVLQMTTDEDATTGP